MQSPNATYVRWSVNDEELYQWITTQAESLAMTHPQTIRYILRLAWMSARGEPDPPAFLRLANPVSLMPPSFPAWDNNDDNDDGVDVWMDMVQ